MVVNNRKYFFVSGLPRSGSTLLCNVLAQNPDVNVSATSGIAEIVLTVRNHWDEIPEFRAMEHKISDELKLEAMRAVFKSYFSRSEKPIVFDKSRAWTGYPEILEAILEEKPKLVICVRDLRNVLASFEKLWRKTVAVRRPSQEQQAVFQVKTAIGRMRLFLSENGIVGMPINQIKDCVTRGYGPQMLFVEYEEFTRAPKRVLCDIYDFLEVKSFSHDFKHVEQITREDDYQHIFLDLHDIRPEVKPQESSWNKVFDGSVVNDPLWSGPNGVAEQHFFWRKLK